MTTLPHGDVGRIINSFVSGSHPDACTWQRNFRQILYQTRQPLPFLSQIVEPVYLVAKKHITSKYIHVIRLPDHRRAIPLANHLPYSERIEFSSGVLPKRWYPQRTLPRLTRVFMGSPVGTNTYVSEMMEPLPWEKCLCFQCCSPTCISGLSDI